MIISKKIAKSIIVDQQLLGKSKRIKKTIDIINHIGYVQIDTISVIERAHHHVLWTRNNSYTPENLRLAEQNKNIFEYWSHAASYLPMNDYRYSLYPKMEKRKGKGHWQARDKKVMKKVLRQFELEGPLKSKDFKKDPKLNYDHAWGGHPITSAIRQLFMEGEIMISEREGFQKVYDITERVLPDHVDQTLPTRDEYYTYLIMRDLKAHGIMTATEIGHLISIPQSSRQKLLSSLCEKGTLIKLNIKNLENEYYALASIIEDYKPSSRKKIVKILSPFDNLIINRKRTQELFDFDYTLECYVTASKRKVGYFSLPLLYGTDLIGQIDLKANRKTKQLIIRNLVWKDQLKISSNMKNEVTKAIEKFKVFNKCQEINSEEDFGLPL